MGDDDDDDEEDEGGSEGGREGGMKRRKRRTREHVRTCGEFLEFKHPHRPIPDDGLALRQLGLNHLSRLGAIIEAHPPIRDLRGGHHLALGVGGEFIRDHHVGGQDELDSFFLGDDLQVLGELEEVFFDEGGTDLGRGGREGGTERSR